MIWLTGNQHCRERIRLMRSCGIALAMPGANSPYAILRHCLGVMEFWGGEVVAGREVIRDRPAEFRSHGPVADLAAAAPEGLDQFRADAATADFAGPPRGGTGHQKHPGELEFTSQGHAL